METKVKELIEKHIEDKDLTSEEYYIEPGWDWSGADLLGWDLHGLKLSSVDHQSNFEKSILSKANLKKADLAGANLRKSYLKKADLRGAILMLCQLQQAHLIQAKLQKTKLSGANLEGADLERANLEGADLLKTCFKKANLKWAILKNANLQEACLTEADCISVDGRDAQCVGTIFYKTMLQDAKLIKAFLLGANLQHANLMNADLHEAMLGRADLKAAYLGEASLEGANLMNADLRESEFTTGTILREININGCKLENSSIKNAYNNLDKIVIQEKQKKYLEAQDVYRNLKNYFCKEGMYELSGEYYYREKLMEKRLLKKKRKWKKWLLNCVLQKIAGYGEKPLNVIGWWGFVILILAITYWFFNGVMASKNLAYNPSFLESLYFSGVTFTTLGFGDLAPKPGIFQIIAFSEALIGAILMAMFIFVFARKMAR